MNVEKEIYIGNEIWGYAYEIELSTQINCEFDRIKIIDNFCEKLQLNKLEYNWNDIDYITAKNLLRNCLTFDIAHNTCRMNKEEDAEKILSNLLDRLDTNSTLFCYTNCKGSPWNGVGYSWNDLTEQTFDIGLVIIDSEKMLFTYFMSED